MAQSKPDGCIFLISAAGILSNNMIKKTLPCKDADLTPVTMVGLALS